MGVVVVLPLAQLVVEDFEPVEKVVTQSLAEAVSGPGRCLTLRSLYRASDFLAQGFVELLTS
jgi:hypothetical protein